MLSDRSIPLLDVLFYVAAVFVAFEAIRRTRTPQGAVGWTVFLFAWPVVAVPLYLLIGYSRVQSYAEARREADHDLPDGSQAAIPPGQGPAARLAPVGAVALHPVTRGNSARLLAEAGAAFDAMVAAIDGAERYVLLQSYIVRDDRIGRRFADAAVRAAERGVKVRMIFDAVGSLLLPRRYVRRLRDAGVELRFQRGPARPLGRFGLNFRNHRKILVTDGRDGFTGGLNLGVEYVGQWRDTQIGLRGPLVQQLQAQFLQDWFWVSGQRLDDDLVWTVAPEPDDMTGVVVGASPTDPHDNGALYFVALAQMAQRRLWIASPYFAPEPSVLNAIKHAALRGVDIRLLVPEVPDKWLPWAAAFAFFDEVRSAGCSVWRYQPHFMHQKVALVDDDVVSIGTFNLDIRSCLLNFETTVVLNDRRFAQAVEAMLRLISSDRSSSSARWRTRRPGCASRRRWRGSSRPCSSRTLLPTHRIRHLPDSMCQATLTV
jgi:cardiolipin synthase A/B